MAADGYLMNAEATLIDADGYLMNAEATLIEKIRDLMVKNVGSVTMNGSSMLSGKNFLSMADTSLLKF